MSFLVLMRNTEFATFCYCDDPVSLLSHLPLLFACYWCNCVSRLRWLNVPMYHNQQSTQILHIAFHWIYAVKLTIYETKRQPVYALTDTRWVSGVRAVVLPWYCWDCQRLARYCAGPHSKERQSLWTCQWLCHAPGWYWQSRHTWRQKKQKHNKLPILLQYSILKNTCTTCVDKRKRAWWILWIYYFHGMRAKSSFLFIFIFWKWTSCTGLAWPWWLHADRPLYIVSYVNQPHWSPSVSVFWIHLH